MKTSDFDYHLPEHFIAQTPVEPRDTSRLLVYNRDSKNITHARFYELGKFLFPGDVLVVNQTRVIHGRLYGRKIPTGGKVELLLLNQQGDLTWEVLVGGKGVRIGTIIQVDHGPSAKVVDVRKGPIRVVEFSDPILDILPEAGSVPLPPYIHEKLSDPERYQTVYAREPGSAAAPTAGLHFTPGLIQSLKRRGVVFAEVTLHVGLDTFAPVRETNPTNHLIHTEWYHLPEKTAEQIRSAKSSGKRVVAVGTTSVRVLETGAQQTTARRLLSAGEGQTDLFILPGFKFQIVDALITNFHLPRSTLLMLVSAFAGREKILDLYKTAMENGYRFYSFGDAMLLE